MFVYELHLVLNRIKIKYSVEPCNLVQENYIKPFLENKKNETIENKKATTSGFKVTAFYFQLVKHKLNIHRFCMNYL